MKNYFLASLLCVAMAPAAFAVPFNTTTVGGTATVGTGGDYATLKAAADAFNALPSPHLQGNWKLEILGDLEEPANVAFGNVIPPTSSLTMKPAANTSSTITFTATVDNGGVSGHLVIGDNDLADWTLVPIERFTIDGSNNGTNSRNLTITNTPENTHSFNGPVSVVGAVNNNTVKNCYLINKSAATLAGVSGVQLVTRIQDGVALAPKNTTLENNLIHVPQTQGHGINLRVSGAAPTVTESITGTRLIGNTIQARLRGYFSDAGLDAEITSNVINMGTVGSAVSGFIHPAIYVNNGRSSANQTFNVNQNQIFIRSANISAGDFGPFGCYIVGAGSASSGNVVNFDNNMVNFNLTGTAAAAFTYTAFRATSGITYNIRHNSINMPDFPNQTGLTSARAAAINLPETIAYTANIQNNIIRVDQAGATGIKMVSSVTPTVTSNNNVIYRSANAFTGSTGAAVDSITNYATLEDWQTATALDAASQAIDPTATAGSKWEVALNNADLHFYPQNVKPTGITLQPRLAAVLTDHDGQVREVQTLPGADEVLTTSNVSDWSVY